MPSLSQTRGGGVRQLDPLRTLTFADVCQRTGFGRRTIVRYLAEDAKEGAPNKRFPVPMKGSGQYRWREISVAKWMEAQS